MTLDRLRSNIRKLFYGFFSSKAHIWAPQFFWNKLKLRYRNQISFDKRSKCNVPRSAGHIQLMCILPWSQFVNKPILPGAMNTHWHSIVHFVICIGNIGKNFIYFALFLLFWIWIEKIVEEKGLWTFDQLSFASLVSRERFVNLL